LARSAAFFGEIALLRDAPRMATVRARTDLHLLTLDRADFLAGVGSHRYTTLHADGIVASRLGEIQLEREAAGWQRLCLAIAQVMQSA